MCRALNLGFQAEAIYTKRGSGTICPKLPWKSKQRSEADMYVDSVFIDQLDQQIGKLFEIIKPTNIFLIPKPL